MTDAFVIRNQLGHYWGKSKKWVDGNDRRTVMLAQHEDEAINTLFELGSKDFELRGEIACVALNERGDPNIEPSQIPLLEPEQPMAEIDAATQSASDTAADSEAEQAPTDDPVAAPSSP